MRVCACSDLANGSDEGYLLGQEEQEPRRQTDIQTSF